MTKMPANSERDVDLAQADPAFVRNEDDEVPRQRVTFADLLAMPGIKDIEFEINRSKELVKPANLPD